MLTIPVNRTLIATLILAMLWAQTVVAADSAQDILDKSRAAYAALATYSDTGKIVIEMAASTAGAPTIRETHTFRTSYRAPRNFLFDFTKASRERFVVWCDGSDFQSWWSATGVHEHYPKGKGSNAFALASYPTRGAIVQISPLLFSTAGLQGPLVALNEPRRLDDEDIDGHSTYKITATVGLAYGKTGAVTNTRMTTVWIDRQSLLVRKVLEDTPNTAPSGSLDRITTSFKPLTNPHFEDTAFRFVVPH